MQKKKEVLILSIAPRIGSKNMAVSTAKSKYNSQTDSVYVMRMNVEKFPKKGGEKT